MGTLRTLAAGLAASFLIGSAASAAVVNFDSDDFVDQEGTSFDVFDATLTDIAGGVTFSASLDPTTPLTGDILLIGFEGATFAMGDISSFSTNTGDPLTAVCNNATDCGGGGGGFTGGVFNSFTFDTIVQVGTSGAASGNNTTISFDIAGVSATDFSILGFRIQNIAVPGGSLKILNDKPEVIPLPAAGWLLVAGLGGLAALRRRAA